MLPKIHSSSVADVGIFTPFTLSLLISSPTSFLVPSLNLSLLISSSTNFLMLDAVSKILATFQMEIAQQIKNKLYEVKIILTKNTLRSKCCHQVLSLVIDAKSIRTNDDDDDHERYFCQR